MMYTKPMSALKKFFILAFFFLLFFHISYGAKASEKLQQASYQEATIKNLKVTSDMAEGITGISIQKIVLKTKDGSEITIEESRLPKNLGDSLKVGDNVIIGTSLDPEGKSFTYIADYKRSSQLYILVGIFLLVIISVGRRQGILSFIGMLISFFIIVRLIVPQILAGTNPIVVALIGGGVIIPITFFLSHGINKKTTIGVICTLIALIITGFIAMFFVSFVRLTGYATEESSFLQLYTQGSINMPDLLLGGIIIGAMGILDDITISQASIVERLREANKNYTRWQLYTESMIVGRDHIASLVNTLVLVYAGASLPLFVLFVNQNLALAPVINHEVIATEVVRTIVSSIGIVLAVPITSAVASWWIARK